MRNDRIILLIVFISIALVFVSTFVKVEKRERIIEEQEIKIEKLEERNATLQEERDSVYSQYWELNNSLEKESAE